MTLRRFRMEGAPAGITLNPSLPFSVPKPLAPVPSNSKSASSALSNHASNSASKMNGASNLAAAGGGSPTGRAGQATVRSTGPSERSRLETAWLSGRSDGRSPWLVLDSPTTLSNRSSDWFGVGATMLLHHSGNGVTASPKRDDAEALVEAAWNEMTATLMILCTKDSGSELKALEGQTCILDMIVGHVKTLHVAGEQACSCEPDAINSAQDPLRLRREMMNADHPVEHGVNPWNEGQAASVLTVHRFHEDRALPHSSAEPRAAFNFLGKHFKEAWLAMVAEEGSKAAPNQPRGPPPAPQGHGRTSSDAPDTLTTGTTCKTPKSSQNKPNLTENEIVRTALSSQRGAHHSTAGHGAADANAVQCHVC